MAYLYNKESAHQENALKLFLQVLSERISPGDYLHHELKQLVGQWEQQAAAPATSSPVLPPPVWNNALNKTFHGILLQAYNRSDLVMMLDFELGKNLNELVREADFKTEVYNLIKKATQEGWIVELVRAAHASNQGNQRLAQFAAQF
jgi:hypothetical protein